MKGFNRQVVADIVAAGLGDAPAQRSPAVYIRHVHDEAAMRLRSYVAVDDADVEHTALRQAGKLALSRGRTSKIQNNVVSVSCRGLTCPWFAELQPLMRKDGLTIASAIISIVSDILGAVRSGLDPSEGCLPLRVLHCVTGDGVNTNLNALRRVLHYFRVTWQGPPVVYRLLVWKCASHQSNLAVVVAICGGRLVARPAEKNPLCAACVRLFKYLMPEYSEEFAGRLRRHIAEKMVIVKSARPPVDDVEQRCRQTVVLRALYGSEVLPDSLLSLFNGDVGKLEHVWFDEQDPDR